MNEEIKKIEWNDEYLLGVPEIDKQHKKLIAIANELYDVVTGDESALKEKMPSILKELTDYTEYHFSNEEELQKKIGYVGLSTHKAAHEFFIKEVGFQIQKLSADSKGGVLGFDKYIVNSLLLSFNLVILIFDVKYSSLKQSLSNTNSILDESNITLLSLILLLKFFEGKKLKKTLRKINRFNKIYFI